MMGHRILDALPDAPPTIDNTHGISSWGMMLNDILGICTIAGLGHSQQVVSLCAGEEITPPDAVIEQGYETLCGYNPSDPSTDQGGVEMDILSTVSTTGFAGMKLLGFVSPDPQNIDHVKKAIALFRSVYVGASMPLSAQNSGVWDVVSGDEGVPGGWGGHCMVGPKYDPSQVNFITWGANQAATWAWWQKYVDEFHVLVWDKVLNLFPEETQQDIIDMLQTLN
jgi:hypothetical protein